MTALERRRHRFSFAVMALAVAAFVVTAAVVTLVLDPPYAMADRGKGKGKGSGNGNGNAGGSGGDDGGADDSGGDDGGDDSDGDDAGGDDAGGNDAGGDEGGGDDAGGDDGGGNSNGNSGGTKGTSKSKSEAKDDEGETAGEGATETVEGEDDDTDEDAAVSAASAAASSTAPDAAGASLSVDRDAGRDRVAGEVVVINDRPGFLERARALGLTVREQQPLEGLGITITRLGVPPQVGIDGAITTLKESFPDLLIDANAVYAAQSQAIELPEDHPARMLGWDASPPNCGRGAAIGVIDTAVDPSALRGRDAEQRLFLDGTAAARSDHGDGTISLLLGSDAADLPGLVPAARLRLAAVFGAASDGAVVTTATAIAKAIDWLITDDVRIINLSLAGGDNLLLRVAVERAIDQGAVLVAAAGNGGPEAPPAYPAAYDDVIAVTAIDRAFKPLPEANHGDYIDLAAPGVDVPVAVDGRLVGRSGTSLAAPFVAATLAVMDAGTAPGRDAAADALAGAAIDLGAPGRDPVYGWGLVQAPSCAVIQASQRLP